MSFDDAWAILDRYLDDACVARYPRVRIIHGKGTGVLRRKINEQLKQDERVASHEMGEYYEGGAGVTVVNMKLD
ncbi:MAG: Endonuclease MutS2 [Candidatus Latescibacteria bacterium ADurb.Bin168]|nr:MAG: Endonuclease MutS2 [Candidatus Latescibacteria bacterium ADurb.Bin168]